MCIRDRFMGYIFIYEKLFVILVSKQGIDSDTSVLFQSLLGDNSLYSLLLYCRYHYYSTNIVSTAVTIILFSAKNLSYGI